MEWLSPIVLVLLPLLGVVLNALAITHFALDALKKEVIITIKLRWLNILIMLICGGIVAVFVGYVMIENIHHKS